MKTALLILASLALATYDATGQRFQYDAYGLTDYVVVEIAGVEQTVLYLKTKDWVKDTYENPDKVLLADFTNKNVA